MADEIDEATIRGIFPSTAHSNVAKYYGTIDSRFENYIQANPKLKISTDDALKLKQFMWATVATENDKCKPLDESVNSLNTNMWRVLEVKHTRHGDKLNFKETPMFANDGKPHVIGNPYEKYDYRKKSLGNSHAGDGYLYRGRGFIQLTGKENYRKYAALAHIPNLAEKPDLANDPINAAKILVAYIMHERVRILKALNSDDLIKAREVVNGRNKGGRPPHGYKKFSDSFKSLKKSSNKPTIDKPQTVPLKQQSVPLKPKS